MEEEIKKFDVFTKEVIYGHNYRNIEYKYYIVIDNEIALINDAIRLGYPTKKAALRAFASKIRWWLQSRITISSPYYHLAASTYIKYMLENHRLLVLTLDEYKEHIKNIK